MSYGGYEYIDDVLDALGIELEEDDYEDVSAQADKTLAEIERLQRIEKALKHAIAVFADTADESAFVERVHVIAEEKARPL